MTQMKCIVAIRLIFPVHSASKIDDDCGLRVGGNIYYSMFHTLLSIKARTHINNEHFLLIKIAVEVSLRLQFANAALLGFSLS